MGHGKLGNGRPQAAFKSLAQSAARLRETTRRLRVFGVLRGSKATLTGLKQLASGASA
jgi:hypothetical protein